MFPRFIGTHPRLKLFLIPAVYSRVQDILTFHVLSVMKCCNINTIASVFPFFSMLTCTVSKYKYFFKKEEKKSQPTIPLEGL